MCLDTPWREFMQTLTARASMSDALEFGLFDRTQETQITSRDLPHWFQPNVAVFITFRTIDSLPKSAILRMEAELRDWLSRNGETINGQTPLPEWQSLPKSIQAEYRRQKLRLWHWELDSCHGECLLKTPELSELVMTSLRYFDGDRYDLDSAVVMPNHVHLVVQFRLPTTCRSQCRSWLKYTATAINRHMDRTGHFWQSEPFDHLVRSVEQFEYLQWYIEQNGPRAKLKSGEFRFWRRDG